MSRSTRVALASDPAWKTVPSRTHHGTDQQIPLHRRAAHDSRIPTPLADNAAHFPDKPPAMAASPKRYSQPTTASRYVSEMARGTHVFKVAGYSLHKGLGVGRFIRSSTFSVGGYDWSIRYYPSGVVTRRFACRVVVYLELLSRKAEVKALFDFRLVDQATGQATAIHCRATPVVRFSTIEDDDGASRSCWGTFSIKKSSEIEASSYLRDDCLVIQCNVNVIKEPRVEPEFVVQVPPSELLDNLGKLLLHEGMKGADVTFKVKDELFPAHKIVLAMRSPVFDAEFYGPMAEDTRQYLTIEDMHPDVFSALLHFIYTDSMPSMEEFDASDRKEMVRHLLVAADRYAVERLKLICEGILCKSISVEDVDTSLALADMHGCHNLRNACVAFISSLNRRSCPVLLDMLGNVGKWMLSCLSVR